MKKRVVAVLMGVIMVLLMLPTQTLADIGPKPSVVIDFKGLEDERYYVTLLSDRSSTGPYSVVKEASSSLRYSQEDEDYEIWKKFVEYEDGDGYYFLQYFKECSDTSQFAWTYYPPSKFKVLLYFPEKDSYIESSKIYERYAFDSYYKVNFTGEDIELEKNYDYTWEIISLLARIIATIGIEILIALFFGFRTKKQVLIILIANVFTQTLLNILLNVFNYNQGSMAFILHYIWMEFVVVGIEATIYWYYLNHLNQSSNFIKAKKVHPILYAFVANIVSFALGLYLSYLIPGIF